MSSTLSIKNKVSKMRLIPNNNSHHNILTGGEEQKEDSPNLYEPYLPTVQNIEVRLGKVPINGFVLRFSRAQDNFKYL